MEVDEEAFPSLIVPELHICSICEWKWEFLLDSPFDRRDFRMSMNECKFCRLMMTIEELNIHERVNRVLQHTSQLKDKKKDCIESMLVAINELKIENKTLKIENMGLKNENRVLKSAANRIVQNDSAVNTAPKSSRLEPINIDSELFTYDYIKNTIRTIGSKVIDCKKDFHPFTPDGQYVASNSNGVVVFACNSSTTNKSKLLFYGASGAPVKTIELYQHLRAIGVSNDTIYLAYSIRSLAYSGLDTLKIESYNFDLCRKTTFTNSSQFINEIFPSIDIDENRIHVKMRIRSADRATSELYRICTLSRNLVEIESVNFSESFLLFDMKIKKDKLVYHSRLMHDNRNEANADSSSGAYVFHLKSLKALNDVQASKRFTLFVKHVVHYGMSFDIGPNGNIFIFDGDKVLLSECDSSGNFVQSVKLKMEPSTGICQITDNFNFVLYLSNKKAVYLH